MKNKMVKILFLMFHISCLQGMDMHDLMNEIDQGYIWLRNALISGQYTDSVVSLLNDLSAFVDDSNMFIGTRCKSMNLSGLKNVQSHLKQNPLITGYLLHDFDVWKKVKTIPGIQDSKLFGISKKIHKLRVTVLSSVSIHYAHDVVTILSELHKCSERTFSVQFFSNINDCEIQKHRVANVYSAMIDRIQEDPSRTYQFLKNYHHMNPLCKNSEHVLDAESKNIFLLSEKLIRYYNEIIE